MANTHPEVMTIEETAQYLRVPLSSLYKLAQTGKIPCQKVGRHKNGVALAVPQELNRRLADVLLGPELAGRAYGPLPEKDPDAA